MKTTIKHRGIVWINLESPSAKEISDIAQEYSIAPLIAEELTSLTMRPKVDIYPDNLYLVLHFPPTNINLATGGGSEIDFVIGKDFLITTHYSSFPPLEKFLRNAKLKEVFRDKKFRKHAGLLAFGILKELYHFSLNELDQIYLKMNKVEKDLFNGNEKNSVKDISVLKRDILDFRRAIYPHESVLLSFEKSGKTFFNKEFVHYLELLTGEYQKIKGAIENAKEIIETLHDTNESLLSTKTNEIMKTLTIMAFITFPLMLLSSIFGMNTIFTPIVGAKYDFWIILLIMIIGTFGMFAYFKKKKWL